MEMPEANNGGLGACLLVHSIRQKFIEIELDSRIDRSVTMHISAAGKIVQNMEISLLEFDRDKSRCMIFASGGATSIM